MHVLCGRLLTKKQIKIPTKIPVGRTKPKILPIFRIETPELTVSTLKSTKDTLSQQGVISQVLPKGFPVAVKTTAMKQQISTTLLRLYFQGQNYSAGNGNKTFLNPRNGEEIVIPEGKETFSQEELLTLFKTAGDQPAPEEVKFLFTFLSISYPRLLFKK